jgi:hypothetical protein
MVDFHEIWQAGVATGGNPNVISFNPIPSTILKWLTFIKLNKIKLG